mgnify:CR=1 FL=1
MFSSGSNQSQVFKQIEDTIVSVIDGYNVCIFAYGQTGSGKTYTMQGPPEQPGVNPRALFKLFKETQERSSQGWTFETEVAMLEIYNEELGDLLVDHNAGGKTSSSHAPSTPSSSSSYARRGASSSSSSQSTKLTITEDKRPGGRGVYCHGLTEVNDRMRIRDPRAF